LSFGHVPARRGSACRGSVDDRLPRARQLVYGVEVGEVVAGAFRGRPVLVRVDGEVPVPRTNVTDQCGEDGDGAQHVVWVTLDGDRLRVGGAVAVRPRAMILIHDLRHASGGNDVVRGHLSLRVA